MCAMNGVAGEAAQLRCCAYSEYGIVPATECCDESAKAYTTTVFIDDYVSGAKQKKTLGKENVYEFVDEPNKLTFGQTNY